MLHTNRVWSIVPAESAHSLAEQLTAMTWCCCDGFSLQGYLFVNDATSPDGAQEYAVLRLDGDRYVQIESITFSWLKPTRALTIIAQVLEGQFDAARYGKVELRQIETPQQHGGCRHCR